jgi:hypothetical protein
VVAEEFAALVKGRPAGAGKWQATCPAHADVHPSLSIAVGRDGRVLIHCWAGCRTPEVLAALGLPWNALFPDGPQPSVAELARVAHEREVEAARRKAHGVAERARYDCTRRLEAILGELGRRLMLLPAGAPDVEALTHLFHSALDRLPERQLSDEDLFDQ